ncbi:MAG: cytoplasmic protein [Magnetococcales bacterium]|nr:cytoplasmic protein [Magnetococcales bacterium]
MNGLATTLTLDLPEHDGPPLRSGFRLMRLEVFNWGTFDTKVWGLNVGGENALLTGDIGSGKSTLVDAVTTLLVPHHRINYNKAAGAEIRERNLRSYVLGYYKSEKGDTGASAKPVALRNFNNYSVILGVFRNEGFDSEVTLAQVFWIVDTMGQPNRFFVVCDGPLSIATDFGNFGTEIAALKKRLKACSGIEIYESFSPYGAAFRRRFGLENEQALDLFHQTVSMKSVGNLTDFVRNHMLEPFDVDPRIRALVAHYDDLTRAHEAVLKAKKQIARLTPLVADCDSHARQLGEVTVLRECREMLHPWFAGYKAGLLATRLEHLADEIRTSEARASAIAEEQRGYHQQQRDIERAIAANGGDRLKDLRQAIIKAEQERDDRKRRAFDHDAVVAELGFSAVREADAFLANRKRLVAERDGVEARRDAEENKRVEASVRLQSLRGEHKTLTEEIESLRSRPSNIPKRMLDLRESLCHAMGIAGGHLPFAGELIRVRPQEGVWEGAIERLLHVFALSMLVPDAHYARVADWVDSHHLSGRLVYYRVRKQGYSLTSTLEATSLVRKLEIKTDSEFYPWLENEVDKRFDYVCCDSMEQFRRESSKAITRSGQIKGGNERHEKDDRRRIDDRTHYVLGWSNMAKLSVLESQAEDLARRIQVEGDLIGKAQVAAKGFGERLQRLSKLETWTDFRDIDWRASAVEIEGLEREKKEIETTSDILQTLNVQLTGVMQELDRLAKEFTLVSNKGAVAADKHKKFSEDHRLACVQRDAGSASLRDQCFPLLDQMRPEVLGERKLTVESCTQAEHEMGEWLLKKIDNLDRLIMVLRDRIIKAMADHMAAYPLETREVDATLASCSEYRRMLTALETDGLPRFEADFKKQLNENAIREIANFQSQLKKERSNIEGRVERINLSLASIDYNPGRFIRLEAEPSQDVDIRGFQLDLRACTEGALTGSEDEGYSEAKFLQVKQIVERFRGREGTSELDRRWTRKVTDVRNWFVFSASERRREDQVEYEHYTDSGGKSGGQKEKLAYTVLAASLAYQFGLDGGSGPSRSFRFVVIDEAFGRGSDESSRFGLKLFRSLGLQLLVVTPLQKIHVIEPFVAAVGFVHNPDGERSLLRNLTIEEFRSERDARRGL